MYDKKVVLVDENFNIEDKAYHTYSCIITNLKSKSTHPEARLDLTQVFYDLL